MFINSNGSSLNAQRNLSSITKSLDTSYTRLASGLRINSAKDDAAGLQISNRLTSQVNGLDQGIRNANDGISVAQTAEGAMEEISNMLQRMRTLAQQSINSAYDTEDRRALQTEYSGLRTEIDRIAQNTTFGGQQLLNGGYTASFQVGADAGQTITLDIDKALTINGIALATSGRAAVSYNPVDGTYKVTQLSGTAGVGATSTIVSNIGAMTAMANLDYYIEVVDSKRAELGAIQNRFDSVIRNQANVSENVSAARSRIRDADFAVETANLTKQNILQQAASSILSQANKRPQSALSLLQS
ncbi:flagellin N-terminal helical domain-containing protein [Aeromonas caviae]|uniref:flagellin N-terminal helical domain-containing protein n=1 Tax=Aeromonas caviae TaxID=648 RepID=UPI002B477AD7|nr:flagellin [Aeromonas caviae]